MAYVINQLVWWLLLAAVFAALAGWAYGALRAEGEAQRLKRERERLLRELVALSGNAPDAPPADLQLDLIRQRGDVADSRVKEFEQMLAAARARADAAETRNAELERELGSAQVLAGEIPALRSAVDAAEAERRTALEVTATPVNDEDLQLKMWRLRYFERRVDYLENQARTPPALPAPQPAAAPVEADPMPLLHAEWRARYAEAAADELLTIARTPRVVAAAPSAEEIEAEQRKHWRALYLERRAHHLQSALDETLTRAPQLVVQTRASDAAAVEDEARRAWRQAYLERRVAHLMQHAAQRAEAPPAPQPLIAAAEPAPAAQAPAPVVIEEEETPPPAPAPLVPQGMEERPPALPAARNGAPDDFTLIEGVSPMLQSTLSSLGVYHFDQIAAWTPANIAWVDQYLRLRGRIVAEEWVEQAQDLAQGLGVARAERVVEEA